MDKLKNMMHKPKDGTDHTSPTGDLTNKSNIAGEGSHFGSSRTTDTGPLSSSANPTGTGTGTHHGISAPPPSRMPGAFDDGDASSTASISSGVPGKAQSGNPVTQDFASNINKPLPAAPNTSGGHSLTGSGVTGTGNTAAGPHSSSLENKLDPRVDSDLDGRSGLTGSGQTQGTGSNVESDRSFPLRGGGSNVGSGTGSGSGYAAPGQVGTYPAGGASVGSGTTAGPHSSNLENKADPRVDSDRDGRSGFGNTGAGAAGTGSGLGSNTTAGPHSSNIENKLDPRVDSDRDGRSGLGNTGVGASGGGYGSGTGPTATSSNTGHLGSGSGIGAGTTGSELLHAGHTHEYKGDPCGPETAVPGAPHFTSGPHATDTANRLDPHVSSGIGAPGSNTNTGLGSSHTGTDRGLSSNTGTGTALGSSGTGTSATPLGSSATGTGHHHHGRDEAALGLGAGAGAAGAGAYEAGRDSTQSSATGPAPNTAGPHKSDALNKLDPRVDSDLSKQQTGTISTSDPYRSSSTSTGQHHTGRDAALAGGAGAAGVGAYEAEKHHHQTQDPTGTGNSSVLGSSNTTGAPHHSHHQGHHDRQQQAQEHHHGRDAAIVGGTGAAGVGAYEAEKHHNQQNFSGLGSSTTTDAPHHSHHHGHHDRHQQTQEHHHGRDAGLVGAGTAGAYEAERHHGHPTQSSTVPSTTDGITSSSRDPAVSGQDSTTGTGHHYGRDAGLVGAGGVGAYEAEKHLGYHNNANQGSTAQGTGSTGLTGNTGIGGMQSGVTDTDKNDHHLGRDAGLAAGAGGVAYEADKHHHDKEPKHHEKEEHHDSSKKSGGILGSIFHHNKGDKEAKKEERAEEKAERKAEHHTGRDAALGAGAAGTAYEAEKHHRQTHGPGDEETAAGAGATGLRSDVPHHTGHPIAGSRDYEHGTQSGVHDSPISSGTGVAGAGTGGGLSQAGVQDSAISSGTGVAGIAGTGPTTHDAYGENDPNRVNRLHKDPPAGRGL